MAIKLFELKGDDFLKGISIYDAVADKGIFQTATAFDPFRTPGTFRSAMGATTVGSGTIDTTIRQLVGVNISGVAYFYAFGGTKVYRVTLTDNTVTDVSAAFTLGASEESRGAIYHKGKVIHSNKQNIYSNDVPATADTLILTTNVEDTEHPLTVGPNQDLYFPNGQYVGRITSLTGTTGNDARALDMGSGIRVKQVLYDGNYLIIIADRNTTTTLGTFKCVVAFWDGSGSTLFRRWDFEDSYLVGGGILDGTIYVIGRNNMYVTNLVTPPKVFVPFRNSWFSTGSFTPINNPHVINVSDGILSWGTSGGMLAYGHPNGGKKIFFRPIDGGSSTTTCITKGWIGDYPQWWLASSSAAYLQRHDATGTRTSAVLKTIYQTLSQPYILKFFKLNLRSVLASGDQVDLGLTTAGTGIYDTYSVTYSTHGAIKTKKVTVTGPTSGQKPWFHDFALSIGSNGPIINSVEVWAEPLTSENDYGF